MNQTDYFSYSTLFNEPYSYDIYDYPEYYDFNTPTYTPPDLALLPLDFDQPAAYISGNVAAPQDYSENYYDPCQAVSEPLLCPPPSSPSSSSSSSTTRPRTQTRTRTLSACTYIEKLFALVNNPEHKDVIDWTPDGRSFLFLMNDRFVDAVLAPNFRSKKIDSFIRQLNGYGFHRVYVTRGCRLLNKRGDEVAVFTHPHFQQDGKLRHHIKRASPTSTPVQTVRGLTPDRDAPRIVSDEYRQGAHRRIRFKMIPIKQKKQTPVTQRVRTLGLGQ